MYKAIRSFKVKGANGEYRMVQPGEAVPEAASWKNVESYVKRRWITNQNGEMWDGRSFKAAPAPAPVPKAPAKRPEVPPVPVPEREPAAPEPVETEGSAPTDVDLGRYRESDLNRMSKSEVQDLAAEMGLDADKKKYELIEDILKNQ